MHGRTDAVLNALLGRFIEASRALRSVPVPCRAVDRRLARRARPRPTRSRSLT